MNLSRFLCTIGLLLSCAVTTTAQSAETAPKRGKSVSPPFVEKNIEGWTVHVSRGAMEGRKKETAEALDLMANQLFQIKLVLPPETLKKLQQVPIWLANNENKLGIAFHPSRNWLTSRGYHPPKPKSLIGIVSGKHYLHESLRQPWLIFHELSHGYDWYILGQRRTYGSQPDAYLAGMKNGKYVSALHWNGRMRKPYHATNKMEFFAETSEAFFGTNDIFPFVRAELRDHDAEAFHSVAAQWNVDIAKLHRDEKQLTATLARQPLFTGTTDSPKRDSGKRTSMPTPTRNYRRHNIEGWRVLVSPALSKKKALEARTLRLLKRDLHFIKRYVPATALSKLQSANIWVEHESPLVPYAAYHTSADWLRQRGGNVDKLHGIEIGNAEKYLRWFPLQPSLLLHLCACRLYETLDAKSRREVSGALQSARLSKQYVSVLRFDGKRVPHAGLKNERAFFAEFSTSLYGANDHFPFVRAEFRKHDAATAERISRWWNNASAKN